MGLPFTLQQLRILKAIATENHFTKAANLLYISQPSLSHQIKVLEKNLNTSLVNRNHNTISLTESGLVFLQYSERILALCEESCRALIDLKNGDRGNLKIGASQTIGTYLMPQILASFAQNYPQINFKIQVYSIHFNLKNVINNEVDIAIVGNEILGNSKHKLTVQKFVSDKLNLIISKSHPFVKKNMINKNDLYCLNFITLNSNSIIKKSIDNTLVQHQIKIKQLNTILQLNSIESIKIAVSLGLGVAFVSSSSIKKEIHLNTLKILEIKNITIKRELFVVSNPKTYKSKTFKFFCHELDKIKLFS